MIITKEISGHNELYLYMNGQLIYKKWLNTGQSKIFDIMAYDRYTYASITDLDIKDSPHLMYVIAKIILHHSNDISSGSRLNHIFEYKDNAQPLSTYIGEILFYYPILEPGKEYIVTIIFPLAQRIEMFLTKGRKCQIQQDNICIGEAEIIEFK